MNVLFVCVENAGRSQIAEALFSRVADGVHETRSAGSAPAERVHPNVISALGEIGIDAAERQPRHLDPEDIDWADVVVTMGCGDRCPATPGKTRIDWQLPDPRQATLEETRFVRDRIALRVVDLLFDLDEGRF